jgi:predicted nucleic acid-binding protein
MNAIDTNVLVYAYDESAPAKRQRAQRLLATIQDGVLLWQVACEFIAATRKTLAPGEQMTAAWQRLDELRLVLPLIVPAEAVLDRARLMQESMNAHYWDCLLFSACVEAGVTRLYTEDVPSSAVSGLEIVNPFT